MRNLLFFCLYISITLFFFPAISYSAVNLPWSTTYNCSDWAQSNGLYNVNCDGISGYGGWTCDNGDGTVKEEQITALASNPNGGGGKGQRQWVGDGVNNNSGGMNITFNPASEIWVRWYMRFQNGFKWSPLAYDKWLYINSGYSNAVIPGWINDKANIGPVGYDYSSLSAGGWSVVMGGSTSDGQWHVYEVHLKTDTNGTDGLAEMWIDGVKWMTVTNLNHKGMNWESILIGSNQSSPSNGACMAVDFDDMAISTTGYIGPISGGATDTTPPSAPSGVIVS